MACLSSQAQMASNLNCSGAPNDGFLPNALKICFRLSGVLLKLCIYFLSGTIYLYMYLYLFGHPRATLAFSNLLGLPYCIPENLR